MTSRAASLFLVLFASISLNTNYLLASELDKDLTDIYLFTTPKGSVSYPTYNGYFWNKWDMQTKIIILTGIDNGEYLLFLAVSETNDSNNIKRPLINSLLSLQTAGFKLSDEVKQIDIFYKDSANLQIPIIESYRYMIKRMNGASQRELDNLAASLRNKYNQK
jgi:hypothetical protein